MDIEWKTSSDSVRFQCLFDIFQYRKNYLYLVIRENLSLSFELESDFENLHHSPEIDN